MKCNTYKKRRFTIAAYFYKTNTGPEIWVEMDWPCIPYKAFTAIFSAN